MIQTSSSVEWVQEEAPIKDPLGLHARPAVKLTKLANKYESSIELSLADEEIWINAKSTNSVMKMKAGNGQNIKIRAKGEDADQALNALVTLIRSNFDS
ncbi:HPr family phosphocarrier protein [Terasakiella sp. A23]|uniref:HPr family phosphocarrier protein n=1 Tax=Terasakiella sp. FCG-A23 TaxID=3080561 RepID=UPI0029555078|nr:HPr family phosphocarrier protein [Terasakiella sp. A23]MDV7341757.1 HPr family phosphocarrier protein [Terasakiella sp. A23]